VAPSSAQSPTHRKPYDRRSEDGNPQDSKERVRAGFPGRFHDPLTPSPGANGLDTTLELAFQKTIGFATDGFQGRARAHTLAHP